MRIACTQCPYCGWSNVFLSRPKRFLDKLLVLILLRPVRCHECMRRFYRPIFCTTPNPFLGTNPADFLEARLNEAALRRTLSRARRRRHQRFETCIRRDHKCQGSESVPVQNDC